MSSDSGDGTADCAHWGLVPLDVDFRMFWRTTAAYVSLRDGHRLARPARPSSFNTGRDLVARGRTED